MTQGGAPKPRRLSANDPNIENKRIDTPIQTEESKPVKQQSSNKKEAQTF